MTTTSGLRSEPMKAAGALVALGALMLVVKGLLLMITDNDRSLVPWFASLSGAGLAVAGWWHWRSVERFRAASLVATILALVGVAAAVVSVGYLVTGTIPETDGAPAAVGASYAVAAAGAFLGLLMLGIVVARNRSLVGWWRWFPIALFPLQFVVFAVSEEIGSGTGSENVTDGLGLALTGALWLLLGYALTRTE